jgi:hypothetical protein
MRSALCAVNSALSALQNGATLVCAASVSIPARADDTANPAVTTAAITEKKRFMLAPVGEGLWYEPPRAINPMNNRW